MAPTPFPGASPLADPAAVLSGAQWRITVLTDGLVRLEWDPDGAFEDRASTFAVNRRLPVPDFGVVDGRDVLEIDTARLHLTYDRRAFSPSGLSVLAKGPGLLHGAEWRYGAPAEHGDLGGTVRTLDMADGRVPLDGGVVSRHGVAHLDDSGSFLFTEDGWVAPRPPGRVDLYVFAYGRDYRAALEALAAVSGRPPLLPRWALGNWWSRYHKYSAESYLQLLDRFAAEGLPFSVAVLDMDWHRVESVPEGSGWTGYSWEPTLFPDPAAFLAEVRRRGLRVTLNVHPADGVRAYEDAYPAMARALGRDPGSGDPIAFDITDRAFAKAYFEELHHPLEDQGVDFWWLDWQQGPYSRVGGIDPLWMLNHLHFLDAGRGGRRPLTFSRYAGPGSHRYPVGFSGDTVISWASLEFQPEFTATASNIGFGWWSHDIGGHIGGVHDDELATRWVQYGVYSPILRLHSSDNPFLVKEPWQFPREAREAMTDALRMRHRLVPYLHTANHLSATEAVPLVRPMYHLHPLRDEAYTVPNQYAFGSELLVAPITAPRDPVTLLGSVTAWLPPGTWTDIVTGTTYAGDRYLELHRDTSSIPVLLKAGGLLPLADDPEADANPASLELLVATGADGRFTLVEDDGRGADVDRVETARTPITWSEHDRSLTIGAVQGAVAAVPDRRSWRVTFLGADRGAEVRLHVDERRADVEHTGTGVRVTDVPTGSQIVLTADRAAAPAVDPVDPVVHRLTRAQTANDPKVAALAVLRSGRPVGAQIAALMALQLPPRLISALVELLTARQ